MSATTVDLWRDSYGAVAARILTGASRATPVLTGTNACVDVIFHIDGKRMEQLVQAARTDTVSGDDTQGRELLAQVLGRVLAGRGGEILRHWVGGPAWISALLGPPDRQQLGGTGPQASATLAVLGAPSVLALADRSARQLAVLHPRTGVCVEDRVVPASSIMPHGEPLKLPHCVLEFTEGTPIADARVPRSSRLILRFGDEPIERDEQFASLTPTLRDVRAGLLSGLNGLPEGDTDSRDWLIRLARRWADAGLRISHHELAEFPSRERLCDALDTCMASSVGLSLSELFLLTDRRGDPRLLARDAAERCGALRVIVHADEWSLAIHHSDPAHETDVLLTGSTLAAARALHGEPADRLDLSPRATFTDDLPPAGSLGGRWWATSVPSPYLRRPAATIGLGDTFAAGILLAESLP
jgi:ADP-dependent phosphofructokinase/glucokinase